MNRRGLLGALLVAPALIRTPGLLMPVKVQPTLRRYAPGRVVVMLGDQLVGIHNYPEMMARADAAIAAEATYLDPVTVMLRERVLVAMEAQRAADPRRPPCITLTIA